VLGGRAMQIIREESQLGDYLLGPCPSSYRMTSRRVIRTTRPVRSIRARKNPLLFDRYPLRATEVDVDCLADGKDTFIAGIMEHIEEAGIHSATLPAPCRRIRLRPETIAELERQRANWRWR